MFASFSATLLTDIIALNTYNYTCLVLTNLISVATSHLKGQMLTQ